MQELTESTIYCPYCGEPISVLLDPGEVGQSYIEDCQVCCRPIVFRLHMDGDQVYADVATEDD